MVRIEPGEDNRQAIDMIHGYLDEIRADKMITPAHTAQPKVREDVQLLVESLRALGFGEDLVVKRLLSIFEVD